MKPTICKTMRFWVLAALVAAIIGCSKVTSENYDQIKVGMSYEEVIDLLGSADQCDGAMGIKNCRWGDDDRNIMVNFAGDKVILFSAKGL